MFNYRLFIIKYILDAVLDGCIIYRLLLVLTQWMSSIKSMDFITYFRSDH